VKSQAQTIILPEKKKVSFHQIPMRRYPS